MRLYAPMYEGDSILRPDAAIGAALRPAFKAPARRVDFVRSNIQIEAAEETVLDLHAVEQRAHELRNIETARLLKQAYAAVARALKTTHAAVVDWFARAETEERDRFFAASANLADLEQRQRHWERTGCAHY